ncbi:hypothetical protein JRQ81_011355 [Phrynocephalus forsythii]|uniref:Phospholipase D3 n=1 Tax=Phrynocephalus forsythii TaxID=171643 RepID=A0A9Q0X5S6_9SAUR|nr:hypothetical protein JRQ81_011355 [Phrynocephalus forsythii]
MKPHVTYQQLKTLHSPEDPPPTGPPNPAWSKNSCCILVTVILSAMLLAAVGVHLLFLPYPGPASAGEAAPGGGFLDNPCSDPCRSTLVESIPEGMTFDDNDTLLPSTFAAWSQLLREAQRSLDIASFYWTLRNEDTHTQEPSAGPGEEILAELLKAPSRGSPCESPSTPLPHGCPALTSRTSRRAGHRSARSTSPS